MLFTVLLVVWYCSKYYSDVMKKLFNKELAMTKKDNENFENSSKCWICDNNYIDKDVKVRDHCHITGKYRGYAHRDCNINVKLNHKIPVIFHNSKNYNSHLVMQKLGKFNLKMSYQMDRKRINKLIFIDSFQFLSC